MMLKISEYLHSLSREDKGFTLIELLVVVAILGVLAAIAVPAVTGAIDDARANTDAANVKILNDALQRYYFDNSDYPADLGVLDTGGYIEAVPVSPWDDTQVYGTAPSTYDSENGKVTGFGGLASS